MTSSSDEERGRREESQQEGGQQQSSPATASEEELSISTNTTEMTVTTNTPAFRGLLSSSSSFASYFDVYVSKDTFKFNAAHFVAYRGFRERLHGHNYRVGVRLSSIGPRIGPDGYVIDYGCVKDVCKRVCKELNEHFLCPIYSNVLKITTTTTSTTDDGRGEEHQEQTVRIECEDGSIFTFPREDCVMLPLVHATTEELCIFLWGEILNGLDASYLYRRGIRVMEVTVAEAVGQESTFRYDIPATATTSNYYNDGKQNGTTTNGNNGNHKNGFRLDVRRFVLAGDVVPMPCLTPGTAAQGGSPVDEDGEADYFNNTFNRKKEQRKVSFAIPPPPPSTEENGLGDGPNGTATATAFAVPLHPNHSPPPPPPFSPSVGGLGRVCCPNCQFTLRKDFLSDQHLERIATAMSDGTLRVEQGKTITVPELKEALGWEVKRLEL